MSLIKSATPRNCNHKALNEEEKSGLIQCAHLILPWLTPSELANISLTCKTLFHFSKTVVVSRSLDASRSFENLPVPFHNTLDKTPYAYFLYTPSQIISSSPSHSPQRQFWGSTFHAKLKPGSLSQRGPISVVADSADCSAGLSRLGPRCEKPGGGCVDAAGELGESDCGCECEKCLEVGDENGVFGCPCSYRVEEVGIASECGLSCRCGLECENRVSQRGIRVRLKIVRVWKKGWGLFADQFIPRGQFICDYAGELLTTKEARRRQKIYDEHASRYGISSALLVVREHLPSGKACLRLNIDATRVGNVARFINHSCDGGNLSTVLVRSSGALLPRLSFFASKDIQEGEELTFSYGEIRLRSEGLPCFCGSSCCFGILPSENT